MVLRNMSESTMNRLFYVAWFLLGLYQAGYTRLFDDEAYYWMFANNMDWGYFDHPPAIAAMIKTGSFLLPAETGVRLLVLLGSTFSIFILQRLIRNFNVYFFWLTAFSCLALGYNSFVASPDSPLVLSTLLYLYVLKTIVEKGFDFKKALLLSLTMSLLMYSKYHGALVIVLSLLPNMSLLRSKYFYLSVCVALVFYIPHLNWQYENDFISVKYHLIHRAKNPFQWSYPLNFMIGHLALFGLLASIPLHKVFRYFNDFNRFDKTCAVIYIGFVAFFLVTSFKSRTEGNWTVAAIIPFIILINNYYTRVNYKKLLVTSSILVVIARILITTPFGDYNKPLTAKLFVDPDYYQCIANTAKNTPVVFMNSYKKAANYSFYFHIPSTSCNSTNGRMNMYNYWTYEKELLNKDIFLVANYKDDNLKKVICEDQSVITYERIRNYSYFSRIKVTTPDYSLNAMPSGKLKINVSFNFEPADTIYLSKPFMQPFIGYDLFADNKSIGGNNLIPLTRNIILSNNATVEVPVPDKAGQYELYLGISAGWLAVSYNFDIINLDVKE